MWEPLVRLEKAWDTLCEFAEVVFDRFVELPQFQQPIALLFIMLAVAIFLQCISFFVRSTFSKAAGPFRTVEAPTNKPDRPATLNPERWLEYFIITSWFRQKRQGIGWFTSRLVAWIAITSIFGLALLSLLNGIGLETIDEVHYAIFCLIALLLSLTHGYAHNTGRRQGERKAEPLVSIPTFLKLFATPVLATICVFVLALVKHHVVGAVKWAFQSISII